VYRRAIELVETQEWCRRRKQTNESSQAEPPSKPLRVTLSHIASVISEVYSSTVSSCSAQESIPLQQKLVACTLLLLVRSQPKKEVTLGKLHEAYTEVCRKRRLKFENESKDFTLERFVSGMFGLGDSISKAPVLSEDPLGSQQ